MKTKKLLFVGLLFALILAACGGGGDDGGDPVGAVKNVVKAMEKLDFEKASEYICEAEKGSLEEALGGMEELAALGIEPSDILKLTFKDMKYEEKSKGDDKAVVRVTGSIKMDIEGDKFKEVMKKAAEEAGETVTDEDLDFMVDMMASMLAQEIPMDGDAELIKEDGKWVVCGGLDFADIAP
jgi:hypothetical protein